LLDSCQYGFGKGLFKSTAPLAPACAPDKFNGFHNSSSFVSFCCPRVHNRCVRNHFLRPGLPIRGRTCQSMGCGCSSSSEAPSGLRPTQGDLRLPAELTNCRSCIRTGTAPFPVNGEPVSLTQVQRLAANTLKGEAGGTTVIHCVTSLPKFELKRSL